MENIKNVLRESRAAETDATLESILAELKSEGLHVEFGKIGVRTTYALIHDEYDNVEIIGYTFVKDMKYYKENVGKLKALQQAMVRKKMSEKTRAQQEK